MKHIGILTNFTSYDKAYSLCNVASAQISTLRKHNYPVTVIVNEGFPPDSPYDEDILRFVPNVRCYNEIKIDDTFKQDVENTYQRLKAIIEERGIQTFITHDLIYQPAYLKVNHAARKIAEEFPNITWLHWIHSATSPTILNDITLKSDEYLKTMQTPFPRSFIVYPNSYEIPRVARNMGYEEDQIRVVNHATDIPRFFDFHPLSTKICDKFDIMSADIIGCYPLRLDRGKQPEYVIKIFKALKENECKVRLLIIDFHSTGGDKVAYREELIRLRDNLGLSPSEVIFTSQVEQELHLSSPQKLVRDFMLISNLFVLPSKSETYSLVVQEAGLCGNLLVLNQDFPAMRSIYGNDPLYRQFSSNIDVNTGLDGETKTKYGNEEGYWADLAKAICYYIQNEKGLKMKTFLRKFRNPDAIFKKQIEPLFYADIK